MARRKAAVQRKGNVVVVSAPAAPRRRSSSRAPRRRSRARRAASRVSGAYSKASMKTKMGGVFVGGFGVGLLEKTFPNLPSLPVVGRKGAIALAVYFLEPKERFLQDLGVAAAALSGYELGKDGRISGYDDSEVFTTT